MRRVPRLAWAIALVVLVLAAAMAVPPVRAAVLEFIQVGAIRIFFPEPTSSVDAIPSPSVTPTPTPAASSRYLRDLLFLGGEVSLSEAEELSGITMPDFPREVGEPDKVLFKELEQPVVVLIWMDEANPEAVRMSLILLGPGAFVGKDAPAVVQSVEVAGEPALWLTGRHSLVFFDGDIDQTFNVVGNVLIWEDAQTTYRLELNEPLDAALRIAEALQ